MCAAQRLRWRAAAAQQLLAASLDAAIVYRCRHADQGRARPGGDGRASALVIRRRSAARPPLTRWPDTLTGSTSAAADTMVQCRDELGVSDRWRDWPPAVVSACWTEVSPLCSTGGGGRHRRHHRRQSVELDAAFFTSAELLRSRPALLQPLLRLRPGARGRVEKMHSAWSCDDVRSPGSPPDPAGGQPPPPPPPLGTCTVFSESCSLICETVMSM